MTRVLVLGSEGMLWPRGLPVLKEKGYFVIGSNRADFDASDIMQEYIARRGFAQLDKFLYTMDADYVVNAIGVTIPHSLKDPAQTLFINGVLPHVLADILGRRLIHITTDCVYSGTDGCAPYTEKSTKSAVDLYGLSKSIGEPTNCVTIRTSIIGRERKGFTGLLEWFLHQKGDVNGYTNHYWNGITTYEFGRVCDKIIRHNVEPGIYHVHSTDVSKFEMLEAFKHRYGTDHNIVPVWHPIEVDRRLASIHPPFGIRDFKDMVDDLP